MRSRRVRWMLWLGAVFAAFTAAQLLVPLTDREFWRPVVVASTVFAFLAFAFDTVRWALMSVPAFVLTVAGLNYFRIHRRDPAGIAVLVATIVLNGIVLWIRLRGRQTRVHA